MSCEPFLSRLQSEEINDKVLMWTFLIVVPPTAILCYVVVSCFGSLSGHIIKCLLTELGQARQKNIWLSVHMDLTALSL